MESVCWSELDTPIGRLGLASTERGLLAVVLPNELAQRDRVLARLVGPHRALRDDGCTAAAAEQIGDYFAGRRRAFDLPLDQRGTPFQRRVWEAVASVPYGATATYGEIARRIGEPRAVRAVGAANGSNPLPIVVPCHRVVGSTGRLTGYAGGLAAKQRLLAHEGVLPREGESWLGWASRRLVEQPSLLIGPRSTRIFCRPDCRYTARLSAVPALFTSAATAIEQGFRACRVCCPA